MSDQYICAICSKPITQEMVVARHYSPAKPMPKASEMVCSRECSDKLRGRKGLYKKMSEAGTSARSEAVTKSNQTNPRRKRKI